MIFKLCFKKLIIRLMCTWGIHYCFLIVTVWQLYFCRAYCTYYFWTEQLVPLHVVSKPAEHSSGSRCTQMLKCLSYFLWMHRNAPREPVQPQWAHLLFHPKPGYKAQKQLIASELSAHDMDREWGQGKGNTQWEKMSSVQGQSISQSWWWRISLLL